MPFPRKPIVRASRWDGGPVSGGPAPAEAAARDPRRGPIPAAVGQPDRVRAPDRHVSRPAANLPRFVAASKGTAASTRLFLTLSSGKGAKRLSGRL